MNDPLNIQNEMRALDLKQRDWYDQLEPELQRKFSPYLMIRWGSAVQGSSELQEYYLRSTNVRLNRHFFSINSARHRKLLWLMASSISPDMGTHRHVWIASKKRESNSQISKLIREMWPNLRDDEVELLQAINADKDIKDVYRQHGNKI